MEEVKNQEKLSYEQLANVAHQLEGRCKQLYAKLEEVNMSNMFKRLDYLFLVLNQSKHFSAEFIKKCSTEIVAAMSMPEEPDTELDNGECKEEA